MNSVQNREGCEEVVVRKRQDLEELMALLEDYKLEIENKCKVKSEATLGLSAPCKKDATRTALVEEMVLINRRSYGEPSMNGCNRNQLDNKDGGLEQGENDGCLSGLTLPRASEGVENRSGCSLNGGINTSDVDELISLFNECLQNDDCKQDSKDVVDFRRASPCSKLVRRMTVMEELLKVKRNSIHGLVPTGVSRSGYINDSSGGCKKLITVPKVYKNPKLAAQKKWDDFD